MNGLIRLFILGALIASLTSCATNQSADDLALDDMDSIEDAGSARDTGSGSDVASGEFSEFDDEPGVDHPASEHNAANDNDLKVEGSDQDLALEQELNDANGGDFGDEHAEAAPPAAQAQNDVPSDKGSDEDLFADEMAAADTPSADVPAPSTQAPSEDLFAADTPPAVDDSIGSEDVPHPEVAESTPAPMPKDPFAADAPAVSAPVASIANITDLQFRASENGGTIIVKADKPVEYTTRSNPELGQFVIEVPNANLPDRLKRSLNTKDIQGSVGAIDAYQNTGSSTARFVIQLRQGVLEPAVQVEGNQLLIVANTGSVPPSSPEAEVAVVDAENDKILPASDLTGFMAGNTKFYGKKISLETSDMDVRDALKFITEESGVNMVIAEEVKGTVNLKLRQVPWDQALVVLMQTKKLGYTRQGNVLRIAPIVDLKAEEDDANKLALSKRVVEPLRVRMFPVSYARVEDLEKKVKDFLGERGKVVGDVRTNSLVVTDITDNLERAAKLIASLDTQPPQVQIEAKIIEAQESFMRTVGVNWGASGNNVAQGRINLRPSFTINPAAVGASPNMTMRLSAGTLDFLGTLQAALALSESENQVKVLSSPRILTMSNEKADINQTTEVPVKTTLMTEAGPQISYQFKPMALKLEVTPQVTADGSVIMKVSVGRQFRGASQESNTEDVFPINSREANTRVLVRNGQTAVIGGIYTSDATENEAGVPWLRKVPVLGSLFSQSGKSKDKSELLVFLTPRILSAFDPNSAAPAAGEAQN